jgi:hypothetical protein
MIRVTLNHFEALNKFKDSIGELILLTLLLQFIFSANVHSLSCVQENLDVWIRGGQYHAVVL